MTFGNSFDYSRISAWSGYSSYYTPYTYAPAYSFNTPLFSFNNSFSYGGLGWNGGSYDLYSRYSGLYNYSPTQFSSYSYYNPFSMSMPSYTPSWGTNFYQSSAYSGYTGYTGYTGCTGYTGAWRSSPYSSFLSITAKYSSPTSATRSYSLGSAYHSASRSLGTASHSASRSSGTVNVGTANNINAYTSANKTKNAGKLSGLSNFTDQTGRAEMCNPEVVDTLVALSKEAAKHGCSIVVTSSFRTYSEQAALNRKKGTYGKRGSSGRVGVAAVAGTSPHEYGQAIDFTIVKNGKQLTISRSSTPWAIECLAQHGMTWGGDFRSVKEPWHFNTSNASAYREKLKNGTAIA